MEKNAARLRLLETHLCLDQSYYKKANLKTPYVSDPITFMELETLLPPAINEKRKVIRGLIEEGIKPTLIEHYENETFPPSFPILAKRIDQLVGSERSWNSVLSVAYEAGRVDLSFYLFYLSHHSAIATISTFGSSQQKKLIPSLLAYEKVACWNYLGDRSKVDPSVPTLSPVEGGYRLNGQVTWAINGDVCDFIVLFAKHVETGKVIGLLLNSKAEGLKAVPIKHKHSIRAASTADLLLQNVFVSEDALLPKITVYKHEIEEIKTLVKFALSSAVAGMMAGAYEVAAHYTRQRVQFKAPLAAFQLTQHKLVKMMSLFQTTYLQLVHFANSAHDPHLGANLKVYATTSGREFIALARELFGGNGITHEFLAMKHLLDMEAAHSLYDDVNAGNSFAGRKLLRFKAK